MPETYIVRFKVLRVESTALMNGRQYTIAYRRGDTNRSTPCCVAEDGAVDFSAMPEGAAVVHFKSGGARFLPKWIMFRLEEYTRGRPRRVVGETQLDCAELLGQRNVTASARRRVSFDVCGVPAQMVVALLVYPENHPPLSFGGVAAAAKQVRRAGVKRLSRGEAMTLLISLETLLERRRADGLKEDASPLARRRAELEERRRALTGVDGMATAVVKKRVEDVVAAQFLALARKHRANYVGEVAAYLRQLAITSGVPLTADVSDESVMDREETQERLQRINARIDTLTQQGQKLEEKLQNLGRMRGQAGATNDTCSILTDMELLQSQLQLLIRTRAALEEANHGSVTDKTPVGEELRKIRCRIRALSTEEIQLKEQSRRMIIVAAAHVLKWARSKNPPTEDVCTDLSTLFAMAPQQQQNQQQEKQKDKLLTDITAEERRQVMEALTQVAKVSAPTEESETSSEPEEESKPHPPNLFGAKGLPSLGDFGGSASTRQTKTTAAADFVSSRNKKTAAKHVDPLMPYSKDDMFGPSPDKEKKNVNSKLPELNFGSSADKENDDSSAASDVGNGGTFGKSALPTVDLVSIEDDPIYDFRPPADAVAAKPFTIEFEDPLFKEAWEGSDATAAKPPAYGFELEDHSTDAPPSSGHAPALPTYSFEPNDSKKNSREASKPRLPTYYFGS